MEGHVFFDASIEISREQFHHGNKGQRQNADSLWVNSLTVGKMSSDTTTSNFVHVISLW